MKTTHVLTMAMVLVIVFGFAGCTKQPTPTPTVAKPTVVESPKGQTVADSKNASFHAKISGEQVSRQWHEQSPSGTDTAISGQTGENLVVLASLSKSKAKYYQKASNPGGSVTTDMATLDVIPLPVVNPASPASQSVHIGDNVTMTADVTPAGTYTYIWKKDGTVLPASGPTLSLQSVSTADAGAYQYVVVTTETTDNEYPSGIGTLTVTAIANPLIITAQPVGGSYQTGNSFSLTVGASGGSTPYTYQWKKGATNVGSNSLTFAIASAATTDSGSYTCVVSDSATPAATATSNAATITVAAPPVPLTITTQPVGGSFQTGNSFSLTVGASGGSTPYVYQWQKGATNIGSNSPTITFTSAATSDSGNYKCVVKDSATPQATATSNEAVISVTTTPVPLSIAVQPVGANLQVGDAFNLTVTVNGGTTPYVYQWKKDGTNVGSSAPTFGRLHAATTDSGSYTCVVSDSATPAATVTSNAAVLTVTAPTPLTITTQPVGGSYQTGNSFSLTVAATGGTTPYTYQWKKGAANVGSNSLTFAIASAATTDSGSYTCVVSDSATPAATATSNAATITVAAPPVPLTITTQPVGGSFQTGSSFSMTVAAGGGLTPYHYQWKMGANNLAGATLAAYAITTATTANSGSYTCTVTDSATPTAASVVSNAAVISVTTTPIPFSIAVQPVGGSYQAGNSFSLTSSAYGGTEPYHYQWQKNGTNLPGATDAVYTINSATTADSGSYTFVAKDSATPQATVTSNAAVVTVTAAVPLAVVIAGDAIQQINEGGPLTLNATVTGGVTPFTYQWHNNGVDVPSATSASYNLAAAVENLDEGFYTVVVTDGAGTIARSPLTEVLVDGRPRFEVSCAAAGKVLFGFNPNGAPIGDTFFGPTVGYDDPTFQLGIDIYGMPTNISQLMGGPADPYRLNRFDFSLGQSPRDSHIYLFAKPGDGHWYQKDKIDFWYNGVQVPAGDSDHPLNLLTGPAIPTWSIVAQTDNQSAKVGETIILSVKTDQPYLPLDYQWYYTAVGGTETVITDGVWGYYILDNVKTTDAGTYRCVITDASGHSVSSNPMTLTFGTGTLAVAMQPSGVVKAAGKTASFQTAAIGGSGTYTYQWHEVSKTGTDTEITGANCQTYTTAPVALADAGKRFYCVITDAATGAKLKAVTTAAFQTLA